MLTLTPGAPLILPSKLTSLELRLSGQHTAATVDGVLTTLAALGSLRQLVFRVNSAVGVDFSVLAASSSLRDLTLQDRHANWRLELSDEQVKQIRTSLGHLQRISLADMTSDELTRFLEPPVTARWQDIGHVLASLLPCCGLTDLYLHCAINTAQLGTLLAKLTQLKKLTFLGQLESLQCFSSCPIMHTLEELTLHGRFPLSELVHLYTLRRLHSLTFRQAFESLDSATFASLSPPTPAFPLLTLFLQSWGRPYQTPVELERKGLSFEWMQKRLTQ